MQLFLKETSGQSSQTCRWRNVTSWDRSEVQAALTNILILIYKAIPVLVDVLQRFLGSKEENRMRDGYVLSVHLGVLTIVLLCVAFMAEVLGDFWLVSLPPWALISHL